MDQYDRITNSIQDLQDSDNNIFINACQTLLILSDTLIFKEIMSHKLQLITSILIERSKISKEERLLNQHLFEEKDCHFVTLEENEYSRDIEFSTKNCRYHSSNLLYKIAIKFDKFFLNTFLPYIFDKYFMDNNYKNQEVGIFLFGKLQPIIIDNNNPISHIIRRLFQFLQTDSSEIKIKACQVILKYAKYLTNFNDFKFFKPLLNNVIPFLLDSNKTIQELGCLSILELDKFFSEELNNYQQCINFFVRKAYRSNPKGNSYLLVKIQSICRRNIQ